MNPGFDQRIADWLEDDPDDAPDIVLSTVLAAFPSIPQRRATRAPWRPTSMNRFLLAVGAASVVAVVLGATSFLISSNRPSVDPAGLPSLNATVSASHHPLSPSPRSAATPDAAESSPVPPLTERVTSPSGHFTMMFPRGWSLLDQGAELRSRSVGLPDALFTGSEEPLPDGQSAEEWLARQEGGCSGGNLGHPPRGIVIGGHAGVLKSSTCPILGGRLHYLAVVVVSGRGYTFHMDSRVSVIDETWFLAALAAVEFES
jgi:hypothetical protein